ncbi:MAG TPA: MarR family transcriptional regulator [Acidimicrobiales bacterium]|nr:MarR family transcriptional regulator [Acidimicrobiales bacterium]
MTEAANTRRAPEADDADAELVARLRLSVMRLARRLRSQADDGVSASQLSALSTLNRCAALTLGELSAAERVKPPTMTRIVAALEEQGLVTRAVDPTDRRVARIALADEGRRLIEANRRRKDAYLAARLAALDPDDRTAIERAVAALDALLEGPA